MPPRRKDTKKHQEFLLASLSLVNLCVFVPLWQKKYISTIILSILFYLSSVAQSATNDWPLFRGKSDLAGKIESELPASPKLLWSIATHTSTKSSPVISEGTIYFGNDKGSLVAVGSTGAIKWEYKAESSIDAAPMIFHDKIIFGTSEGILMAVNKSSGKLVWKYTTENQIAGSANVWVSGRKAGISSLAVMIITFIVSIRQRASSLED